MEHEALTRTIIGCAMVVHRELGPGVLESVYQHALLLNFGAQRLEWKRKFRTYRQPPSSCSAAE